MRRWCPFGSFPTYRPLQDGRRATCLQEHVHPATLSPISERTEFGTEKATPTPPRKPGQHGLQPALLTWAPPLPRAATAREQRNPEMLGLEGTGRHVSSAGLRWRRASSGSFLRRCLHHLRRAGSTVPGSAERTVQTVAKVTALRAVPRRSEPSRFPQVTTAPSLQGLLRSMEEDQHFTWLAQLGPAPRPLTLEETLQEGGAKRPTRFGAGACRLCLHRLEDMAVTIAAVDAQLLSVHPPSQLEASAQLQEAESRAAEASREATELHLPRSPELHQEEEPREQAPAATPKSAEIAGELLRKKVKSSGLLETPDTASVISRNSKKELEDPDSTLSRFLQAKRSPAPSTRGTPRPHDQQKAPHGSRSRVSSEDSNAYSDVSFFVRELGFAVSLADWKGPERSSNFRFLATRAATATRNLVDRLKSKTNRPTRVKVIKDADELKKQLHRAINEGKKAYNVEDLYWKTGVMQKIARSSLFQQLAQNATLAMILGYALWLSYDTDANQASTLLAAEMQFQVMEHVFCAYFLVAAWQMTVSRVRYQISFGYPLDMFEPGSLHEAWVMTIVLLLSDSQGTFFSNSSSLRLIRLLRLSRVARIARLLRAAPELMIMVKGMMLGVLGTAPHGNDCCSAVDAHHRSLGGGCSLCLRHCHAPSDRRESGWPPLLQHRLDLHALVAALCDVIGLSALFLVVIALSAWLLLNMLIGVMCEVVSGVSQTERQAIAEAFVREKVQNCHIFTLWNYSRPVPEYIHLNLQSWQLASKGRCGAPVLVNRSNVRQWIPDAPEEPLFNGRKAAGKDAFHRGETGEIEELFRIPYEAAESDAIRYALIYHNGGIYMDTDFLAIDMSKKRKVMKPLSRKMYHLFNSQGFADAYSCVDLTNDLSGSVAGELYKLSQVKRRQVPHGDLVRKCANDGGLCHCQGIAFYGRRFACNGSGETNLETMMQTQYEVQEVSSSIRCGEHDFGGDPLYGELTFEEFLNVIMSLRGSNAVTLKDIMDLRRTLHRNQTELRSGPNVGSTVPATRGDPRPNRTLGGPAAETFSTIRPGNTLDGISTSLGTISLSAGRIFLPSSIAEEVHVPDPPAWQQKIRSILEHHEVIEARQALARKELQELLEMLPEVEAAQDAPNTARLGANSRGSKAPHAAAATPKTQVECALCGRQKMCQPGSVGPDWSEVQVRLFQDRSSDCPNYRLVHSLV
eukprot:g28662.t1